MHAKEIMTTATRCCSRDTNLAAAAALMLDGDCGILPVVDEGRLVGVVTDRDLYIALATRDKRASEMTVGDVAQGPVVTCGPDDDLHVVLDLMRRHRVRRIPVAGFGEALLGIISINDIVVAATSKSVRDGEVVNTLRTICAHHHPAPHVEAA
jgi:CBS domain-containing protein